MPRRREEAGTPGEGSRGGRERLEPARCAVRRGVTNEGRVAREARDDDVQFFIITRGEFYDRCEFSRTKRAFPFPARAGP